VIDGGTLEHAFDSAKAIKNMANMVKAEGYVFHFSPCAGWVNHGLYNFSPNVFFEFYRANDFRVWDLK
jgi:hypothetical protein